MSSLLEELKQKSSWQEYAVAKAAKGFMLRREQEELASFIEAEAYQAVAKRILNKEKLSIPRKRQLNKLGSDKQRIVYSFQTEETWVLKLLAHLLYRYDDSQSPACFSFRKDQGVHRAIRSLINVPQLSDKWCYKLDISDYFNSISVELLLPILKEVTSDDPRLYDFLAELLSENQAAFADEIIVEARGVMAGTPIAPFLANLYLREIDDYFVERNVVYARYSDDIIFFADSEEELLKYQAVLLSFLDKYRLNVIYKKEKIVKPQAAWEFLGISYRAGRVDLSQATKDKIKGKIRRKARVLRRWQLRKGAGDKQTMKVMIRCFNRKFFALDHSHELNWSRWFFPLLNDANGLQEIDQYLQQYIRYIPSGKHRKKNYQVDYRDLKELGYRSLVNEYYRFLKNPNNEEKVV